MVRPEIDAAFHFFKVIFCAHIDLYILFVLLKVVFFPEFGFGLFVLIGEIVLEAGAEIDMPPPESSRK